MSDWSWFDFVDLAQFGGQRYSADAGGSSQQVLHYYVQDIIEKTFLLYLL
jgi:hypothetical protein